MLDETCFGRYREPVIAWTGTEGMAVVKPAGIHSAPGGKPDVLSLSEWVFERYPEAGRVVGRGNEEGGLIHRLDRDTEGLVLFALTDGFFASLAAQAAAGEFTKSYLAKALPGCGGLTGSRPLVTAPSAIEDQVWKEALRRQDLERLAAMLSGTSIEGRFRPYGPGSRRVACSLPCNTSTLKNWTRDHYRTTIQSAQPSRNGLLVDVRLSRGFRHQVRAHLAWLGLSLEDDPLYGEGEDSTDFRTTGKGLKLLAYALSFKDPATGERLNISLPGM